MNNLLHDILKEAGVSDPWLEVAELIGQENFISMWKRLSEDAGRGSPVRVFLPKFSTYSTRIRNLYIKSMAERGMKSREILNQIKYEQGTVPSLRHIQRIIKGV